MNLDEKDIEFGFWSIERRKPLDLHFDDERIYTNKSFGLVFYNEHDRSKEIKEWNKKLAELDSVEYLWTYHKLSQHTFEIITQMKNIRGLNIKWSSVKDISTINNLMELQYLNLGLSSSIESIQPISSMKMLLTFESEGLRKVKEWDSISELTQLEGLGISGGMYKSLKLDSIQFLSTLKNLRYLFLIATRIVDKNLKPLEVLHQLECLRLANEWKESQFEKLRIMLPNLKYGNVANDKLTVKLNEIFKKK